jgi:hypothetical protein
LTGDVCTSLATVDGSTESAAMLLTEMTRDHDAALDALAAELQQVGLLT